MKKYKMDELSSRRSSRKKSAEEDTIKRQIASADRQRVAIDKERKEIELQRQRFMDEMDKRLQSLDDSEARIDKRVLDLFEQLRGLE